MHINGICHNRSTAHATLVQMDSFWVYASQMQASILAVGSELLLGQTINRNATWLSAELFRFGIITKFHLTVADDREQILWALGECSRATDIVLITGGLGPTTDDFTREVVAQYTDLELCWDEKTWKYIQELMAERHLEAREMQKRQCFFPCGAEILFNPQGTAHGFMFSKGKNIFVVLPGPPFEIAAVWETGLKQKIAKIAKNLDPYLTKIWDTIGLPESELAHILEPILERHHTALNFRTLQPNEPCLSDIAYRVHLPYVEFKITHLRSQSSGLTTLFAEIDQALKSHLLPISQQDLISSLAEEFKAYDEVIVVDQATQGRLMTRLQPLFAILGQHQIGMQMVQGPSTPPVSSKQKNIVLELKWPNKDESRAFAGLRWQESAKMDFTEVELKYNNKSTKMRERAHQYFIEQALNFWLTQLRRINNER